MDQRVKPARRVAALPGMRAETRQKQISLEAATLLTEGKFAEAVQAVRVAEGVSLKEARRRVDAHIAGEPLLGVQFETQRREFRRKFFYVFLFVDACIAAGVVYYFFYMPR
jgi:hypothetical protein